MGCVVCSNLLAMALSSGLTVVPIGDGPRRSDLFLVLPALYGWYIVCPMRAGFPTYMADSLSLPYYTLIVLGISNILEFGHVRDYAPKRLLTLVSGCSSTWITSLRLTSLPCSEVREIGHVLIYDLGCMTDRKFGLTKYRLRHRKGVRAVRHPLPWRQPLGSPGKAPNSSRCACLSAR